MTRFVFKERCLLKEKANMFKIFMLSTCCRGFKKNIN